MAAAESETVLVLDSDFVLPKGCVAAALELMAAAELEVGMLERRDSGADWEAAQALLADPVGQQYLDSAPRATSSTGLALLCSRRAFLHVRGLDERPELADHAGPDLVVRLARGSVPVEWLQGPAVTAYHLEPECARPAHHLETDKVLAARDTKIAEDPSIYRNLASWSVPRGLRPVLVTVAVSTRDRCAYLGDSINSILAQTFQDFELLVVDDGSTDGTRALVEGFHDPRVRYVAQEPAGISVARNRAADLSRGHFTAVHDDDDIMLPWRLETGLAHLQAGTDATYGAWVNFDDDDASMVLHYTRREFTPELLVFNGQSPAHATWMVPTALIRRLRYDETLSSAVDHNLASRMMWSGVRWRHVGKALFLRRLHPRQVSATDSSRQRSGAALTRFSAGFTASGSGRQTMREVGAATPFPEPLPERTDLFAAFSAYLPDHLVRRSAVVVNAVTNKVLALDRLDGVQYMLAEHDLFTGSLRLEMSELEQVTWQDLARMRERDLTGIRIEAERRTEPLPVDPDQPEPRLTAFDGLWRRLGEHMAALNAAAKSPAWLVFPRGLPTDEERDQLGAPQRAFTLVAAADHGDRAAIAAVGYAYWEDAIAAMLRLPEPVESGRLLLCDPGVHRTKDIFAKLESARGEATT